MTHPRARIHKGKRKRAQGRAAVGCITADDVARVVQRGAVEKWTGGIEAINVITNNTPVTLAIR